MSIHTQGKSCSDLRRVLLLIVPPVRLASASSDKTVIVWNPSTGSELATLEVGPVR